ncbi:hypothetical protein CA12_02670 [Alienimonas californiensis]|uniref:Uncharacterized protein n=1 Tax=Alienimonas californiensis TaxID=2527989 RepID=A0A517P4A2_9PLAN|nr:hypothetical protein CA12_02670 [Alienimonas californiensis]
MGFRPSKVSTHEKPRRPHGRRGLNCTTDQTLRVRLTSSSHALLPPPVRTAAQADAEQASESEAHRLGNSRDSGKSADGEVLPARSGRIRVVTDPQFNSTNVAEHARTGCTEGDKHRPHKIRRRRKHGREVREHRRQRSLLENSHNQPQGDTRVSDVAQQKTIVRTALCEVEPSESTRVNRSGIPVNSIVHTSQQRSSTGNLHKIERVIPELINSPFTAGTRNTKISFTAENTRNYRILLRTSAITSNDSLRRRRKSVDCDRRRRRHRG